MGGGRTTGHWRPGVDVTGDKHGGSCKKRRAKIPSLGAARWPDKRVND